jgi:hypothetical protein
VLGNKRTIFHAHIHRSVTDDDAAKLSSRSLEDYDTIRVEITQVTRKGKQNHEYVKYDYQCELPENPVVHEDSKPAVYGYKTG